MKNEASLRALSEEQTKLLQNLHEDLKKQYDFSREECSKLLRESQEQQEIIRNSIGKTESIAIVRRNEKLESDLNETRAALLSFKNMQSVVSE